MVPTGKQAEFTTAFKNYFQVLDKSCYLFLTAAPSREDPEVVVVFAGFPDSASAERARQVRWPIGSFRCFN